MNVDLEVPSSSLLLDNTLSIRPEREIIPPSYIGDYQCYSTTFNLHELVHTKRHLVLLFGTKL